MNSTTAEGLSRLNEAAESRLAGLVVTHHDAQAIEADRVKCVLVGDVVADVDRQHGLRACGGVARGDVVEHPMQRLALVPVDVRSKFDDLAAGRCPQAFGAPESSHRRDHVVDVFRIHVSVVHSDGKALVLHQCSRDIAEVLRQSSGGMRQGGDHRGGRGILVVAAIRCDQFEAVATGEP